MPTTISTRTSTRTVISTTTTVITAPEPDWRQPALTDFVDDVDLLYGRAPFHAGGGDDPVLLAAPPAAQRAGAGHACRWDDYAVVCALLAGVLGLACGHQQIATCGGAIWLMLTALFCLQRLRASPAPRAHWRALLVGSALIPPLAVSRRLAGALRRRRPFA